MEAAGVARILTFMSAHPDGFASLDDARDAIAAYNPHRPPPRDTVRLHKNLRQGSDGRYRWHWDPRFLDHAPHPTGNHRVSPVGAAADGSVPLGFLF